MSPRFHLILPIVRLLGLAMQVSAEGRITEEAWGAVEGLAVKKYTLRAEAGREVDVITYGATITSVRMPDRKGKLADVVLGFDSIEGYLGKENPYFGASIGRVANRIGDARYSLDGSEYRLSRNAGQNSLHGGKRGWSSKVWDGAIRGTSVVMSLLSEDGDEGYPGAVVASVVFRLTADGELRIEMKAFTTKPTPINLTNHSYFNLAGHGTNATEMYKHRVLINADRWTVTDAESIPTGELRPVEGSPMDLRNLTTLGEAIAKVPGAGYDSNFCLPEEDRPDAERFVAKAIHPESGRTLEVYSNQPGVQFYTSNFLPRANGTGILGKAGQKYFHHGAFCFETQNYPDAINHANFPDAVVRPSDLYHHVVVYKFGREI
ncbi:hypothetical protein KM043_000166 [Ampulex compressa]|nr:hypothetical protein KM043_000166 [Ampulex compressa]